MKIEIWSDIACPFCYIGKHNLELAIKKMDYEGQVEIIWRSYILDHALPDIPVSGLKESLALRKGLTVNQVNEMTAQVENMAQNAGLFLNFNAVQPVSTLNAHKLLQLGKNTGLGSQAKERLFKAYFVEGKNIADKSVLNQLGLEIGITGSLLTEVWNNVSVSEHLNVDLYEAQTIGISGVPYFLIDRKYAISGAQPVEFFINALRSISEKNSQK